MPSFVKDLVTAGLLLGSLSVLSCYATFLQEISGLYEWPPGVSPVGFYVQVKLERTPCLKFVTLVSLGESTALQHLP